MSDTNTQDKESSAPGSIGWTDLTVADAPAVRDFYEQVVGWQPVDVEMGGYQDYCMREPSTGRNVAGVCHARGVNKHLPPVWLIYIRVADLEESLRKCVELGGRVLAEPAALGPGARHGVIADPAGAICAVYEQALA
ncbi:MAG: VOC family protein [Bryobacterales bacterium]|nr:VOC family protein [Bryobacterales bacterium]